MTERILNEFRSGIYGSALREINRSLRMESSPLPIWCESVPRKIRELYKDSLTIRPKASSEFVEVLDDLWLLVQPCLLLQVNQVHRRILHLLLCIPSIVMERHLRNKLLQQGRLAHKHHNPRTHQAGCTSCDRLRKYSRQDTLRYKICL
jgi:hypothetical protein